MMKIFRSTDLCILVWILLSAPVFGQGSAGTGGKIEPRYLVDIPTAGMLAKGSLALDIDFYQEGGVLLGISAGIFDRLSFGISYGGSKLIGGEKPVMNDAPGVNLKIRVIEENIVLPAIAIGFDSQGKDGYLKELDRYRIKSAGVYAVASKNYSLAGFLSIHGGVNYSFEGSDDDRDPNMFAGIEKTVGSVVSVTLEYNLAANDTDHKAIGRGRGYINAGFSLSFGGGLTLGVNIKDLAQNGGNLKVANRTVHIEYVKSF
jgi:hypothetical protein